MNSEMSETSEPSRVSVVIPLYNGERYVAEAIETVLAQSLQAFEIIVVNDGSTDGSLALLDSYGKRIVRVDQDNDGTAAARNAGVKVAKGELLAFLDQDDYWTLDKLERQVALLRANPSLHAVWGMVQQFISPELPDEFKNRFRCPKDPVPGYLPCSLLIRRAAFEKVGLFDVKWRIGEWADWYARFTQAELASEHVSGVVAYRRIHEGNKGITMVEDRKEYISLIRENLKRKRAK